MFALSAATELIQAFFIYIYHDAQAKPIHTLIAHHHPR